MGPTVETQTGPTQEEQHEGLTCCRVQESPEEESNKEEYERVIAEKEVQVMAEEEMEEVDLGSVSQGPRPISISASLTENEKKELVLLLKEFKDIFA